MYAVFPQRWLSRHALSVKKEATHFNVHRLMHNTLHILNV